MKARVEEKIASGDIFVDALAADAKAVLQDYNLGTKGEAAKRLAPKLEGKSAPQMETILDNEANATKTTQQVPDPTNPGGMQTQVVYEFGDGTMIRIKPKGDKFNKGQVMFSIEVKKPAPPAGTPAPSGQNAVAFKVDAKGRPVPKGPNEIKNPYDKGTRQKQHLQFEQDVLNAGHQKGTP